MFGGYSFPKRLGGGGTGIPHNTRKDIIRRSLLAQKGTGLYDTTQPSNVYLEAEAMARAIDGVWSASARLGNQWQPAKLTDMLTRWEAIFGLFPLTTDTLVARRAAVATAMARFSVQPNYQAVYDACRTALGSVFVGVVHTTTAAGANGPAVVYTPTGWGIGTSPDPAGLLTWYSNIAHVLIQVVQPSTMGNAEFYNTVGKLGPILDQALPAWCTWNYFSVIHTGGTVKGFFLDEKNLNIEVFAT